MILLCVINHLTWTCRWCWCDGCIRHPLECWVLDANRLKPVGIEWLFQELFCSSPEIAWTAAACLDDTGQFLGLLWAVLWAQYVTLVSLTGPCWRFQNSSGQSSRPAALSVHHTFTNMLRHRAYFSPFFPLLLLSIYRNRNRPRFPTSYDCDVMQGFPWISCKISGTLEKNCLLHNVALGHKFTARYPSSLMYALAWHWILTH